MKDNENYNLTSLGFIQDFEKEISFLLELSQDLPMTTFSAWKHQLLNTYYAERQFPAFVQSNINVPLFIENIYSKAQNMVETKYWKESPAEVNTYIAAFKDSLAYLLPRDLFLKYYHYYFTTDLRLNTPEELYIKEDFQKWEQYSNFTRMWIPTRSLHLNICFSRRSTK